MDPGYRVWGPAVLRLATIAGQLPKIVMIAVACTTAEASSIVAVRMRRQPKETGVPVWRTIRRT